MQFNVILRADTVCVHPTTYPVSLPSPHCTLHEISEETKRIWSALMSHIRITGGRKKEGIIETISS